MRLAERFLSLFRRRPVAEAKAPPRAPGRGRWDHVVILDGTMSTLDPGAETNAGQIFRLLKGLPASAHMSLYYEPGAQWRAWRKFGEVAFGQGIEMQVRRAYGWLATRYRPGDRIFLFGYSRGAFAVRSLAGIIDQVGLVQARNATERNVNLAFRYYQAATDRPGEKAFVRRFCHEAVQIEVVGVFDTVKALGLRLPLIWVFSERAHQFHNHALGPTIRHGFHALALDETRSVFEPVMWETRDDFAGHVEQMWFRGAHGDIGGQLGGFEAARTLANIPLVWMLERAESSGLPLPEGWHDRYVTDPLAPSVGTWRGWGKGFLFRAPRVVGRDRSERLHPTVSMARKSPALLVQPPEALSGPT